MAAKYHREVLGYLFLKLCRAVVRSVASKTGAWEDIIEEDVHGKLVPCNDTNSAHEALMNLTSKAHQLEQDGTQGKRKDKTILLLNQKPNLY